MSKYEIELTDTEDKAMSYCTADIQKWAELTVKNRARISKDEILNLNMQYCNSNGIAIAESVEKQIEQAFTLKVIKTAKEIADAEETKPE